MAATGGASRVCDPQLPDRSQLLPYLQEIDQIGYYTNHGPLLRRFERRLADHFGVPEEGLVCVANGTAGLNLALRAKAIPEARFCIMPAWTFAATPHAAFAAGLIPYFVDVDPQSWSLTPAAALAATVRAPGPVGAVAPVSPLGAPVDTVAWDAFSTDTGIPVVIDAAGGFDSAKPGRVPMMISFHATKIFGVGEGGLIVSTDGGLVNDIRRLANFGFGAGRAAQMPAINAKMSEYPAAVGLAGLDGWTARRAGFARLGELYRDGLGRLEGLTLSPGFGTGWVASTCVVAFDSVDVEPVAARLMAQGVASHRWWGLSCHVQPAFADCPREPLPVTDDLAPRVLGLPHHLGLDEVDLFAVLAALGKATMAETRKPSSESSAPRLRAVGA